MVEHFNTVMTFFLQKLLGVATKINLNLPEIFRCLIFKELFVNHKGSHSAFIFGDVDNISVTWCFTVLVDML